MTGKMFGWALTRLRILAEDERAASLVEYALLIAIVVILLLGALHNFSSAVIDASNYLQGEIEKAINKT